MIGLLGKRILLPDERQQFVAQLSVEARDYQLDCVPYFGDFFIFRCAHSLNVSFLFKSAIWYSNDKRDRQTALTTS